MHYIQRETEESRAIKAIDLVEWAIMLLKAAMIAQILAVIMLFTHHAFAGVLLLSMNFALFGIASGLRKRAGRIYPEGEEPKW